jgi:hypothetical protein
VPLNCSRPTGGSYEASKTRAAYRTSRRHGTVTLGREREGHLERLLNPLQDTTTNDRKDLHPSAEGRI